ncbi:glycosyltransferase family 2 protein [Streptomyces himalayensis]|uniref:Glycosyltransferase family 2 protein n=1 Tax=Streptomyces himalayensis subsp. himalayensis TaxID=2756131 RepID=A0A7W0DFU8_9ACTN|nr:glycosyltransferase family 2 protein [Streptomyces himalayensis]MBA2944294.1 glycosyltransferase family 2 protein [Streptomyces himalayensis subsp. himalayensis]
MKLTSVIACYNVAPYLPDCIATLKRNAGTDIEFVFVDDNSTDDTPRLLEEAVHALPNSTLIRHSENRGVSATRNSGTARAGGEYITYLDGDDWLAPGYYPRLAAVAADLGTDFIKVDHIRVTGTRRTLCRAPEHRRRQVLHPLDGVAIEQRETMIDYPNTWSGAYSRRLVDAGLLMFDPALRTCEDRHWTWRLHMNATSYAVVGLDGLRYRRDVRTSLTRAVDDRQLDFLPAFENVINEVASHPMSDHLLPKAIRSFLGIVHHHIEQVSGYQRSTARRFCRRYRQFADTLPQDLFADVIHRMDERRRNRLLSMYRPKGGRRP